MIFAVDNAHWKLLLYLFDDVYVNVVAGGGKVLLDLVIEKGGEGMVDGRGWWSLPALYGSNLLRV